MSPTTSLTSANKKLSAFKARTCPTLKLEPLFAVTRGAILVLGTAYNVILTVLASRGPSQVGMILRASFTMLYFPLSFLMVCLGLKCKGRRRVLGLWVGKTHIEVYLVLSALVYLVAVCAMLPAVSGEGPNTNQHQPVSGFYSETFPSGTPQTTSGSYSFPWLTTLGPGGVAMMLVCWIARSEPEEYGDGEDDGEAGLPAYSLVEPRHSSSSSDGADEGRAASPKPTPVGA